MDYIRSALYDDIVSNSNVISGKEYRELICAIAQVASDMVVKTLGPYGSTTVIDDGSGFTYPSKDGWSCLSKLQFTDPTYNTIYSMLKKVSFNSVTTVGDGTTTAMVAASNFLKKMYGEFIPLIEKEGSGFRQATFIEDLMKVYDTVEENLRKNPNIKTIDTDGDFSDIRKIAYVATNGNTVYADMIQEIYKATGNPYIHVTMDKIPETTYEIQKGYKFDARTINFPSYINDSTGIINNVNHPQRIIVFDHNVTFQSHQTIIGSISQLASRDNIEVMILAPYFDDIVTSWIDSSVQKLVQSHQKPNIMLIQVPTTLSLHRQTLSDLCVLTNAQMFDDAKVKAFNILYHNQTHPESEQIKDDILTLEKYNFSSPGEIIDRCLGTTKSVVITRTEGFIQDYEDIANKVQYRNILKESEETYKNEKAKAMRTIGGALDKEFLFTQMRYIKLKGSTGVIKVGGISDIQQRCDKDSLDDAVLACRSAFENGYVRGMNIEILRILNNMLSDSSDIQLPEGIYTERIATMLMGCIYETSLQVIRNKRPNDDEFARIRIIENEDDVRALDAHYMTIKNFGILDVLIISDKYYDYDLRKEEFHTRDMWEVVNSTATDIEILRAIVNVLAMIITSNQFLSMTRRYDPRVTDEKSLEHRMEDESKLVTNKVNAALSAVSTNIENNEILCSLIKGILKN